jgi:DNA-binding beta-propeller fold protein YncE
VISDGFGNTTKRGVTILDLATRQEIFSVQMPPSDDVLAVDAVPSANGSRLYIAAQDDQGKDYLFAVDARNHNELWRTPIQDRVEYIGGNDLSTLALSPDGLQLYVYSYPNGPSAPQYPDASYVPNWLQIIDTNTGKILPDTVPLPTGCNAADMAITSTGQKMYVLCFSRNDLSVIALRARRIEEQLSIPSEPALSGNTSGITGGIKGFVLAPDGRNLYILTDTVQIAVFDIQLGKISRWIDVGRKDAPTVPVGSIGISRDGSRLVIGLGAQGDTNASSEFHILDTQTWQILSRFRFEHPIKGSSILLSRDGKVVYGVSASEGLRLHGNTILSLDTITGQAAPPIMRGGEEIVRIFLEP